MVDFRPILGRRRAAELTVEPLIDTLAEFAGAVSDAVGKDYNLDNPRAARHLREYMAERVGMINSTTRKALLEALDAEDPRAAVRKVFAHARDARAPMIAVGEVTRTSNWASIDAGRWRDELAFKQWISQHDGHVRDTHVGLDGQVVGWLEDFISSSGARGPHPGELGDPAEDINCRCYSAPTNPRVKKDIAQGQALQEAAEDMRAPFVERLETAWRDVFAEQEAAVLEALG